MPDVIREPARETPVSHTVDLLVAGGGASGVAAAVSAARMGLSVVMAELTAIPGGMITHVNRWFSRDFENKGGYTREFLDAITELGFCEWPYYNPFPLVPYFDDVLESSGARPLYLTGVAAPLIEDGRLAGAIVESKSGRHAVRARIVIDATGDGDLAARAGARFSIGRPGDGACQSMSISHMLMDYVGPAIDADTFTAMVHDAAQEAGSGFELPYDHWRIAPLVGTEHAVWHTIPHVTGHDPLSAEGLSDALVALRRQAWDLYQTLKEHAEPFRDVAFGPVSCYPGVRESRRIVCDAEITSEAVRSGQKSETGLFTVVQSIDMHKPTEGEPSIVVERIKPYHVPYGALLPQGIENLLVIGRCIGGSHEACSSYRVVPDCMAMGEAAALATRMAIEGGCTPREIAVGDLIGEMANRGYQR
ncbi:MAG: FAD-dependent oxidoreductase [Candidatus Latescibacteria bacterium]|jgi:hypothetical protein|nr:FAD-dependent oxidoreductase [Candidatus Latescibacterota bacterium]